MNPASIRGRRRLSKRGHPEWRRLLIAAAMSAARTQAWRDYVNLQRAKALPATAVHVILARKMLRTAFCCARPSPCSRMDKTSFPQVFNPLDTNHRIFRGMT